MIKPPLLHGETQRLKSLHSLKILDTQPEERFDRITRLAQLVFDVPIALVSLVDSERQWFKSKQGLGATETPRDISFCGHAIADSEVFVIPNATDDQRFCDNPLVVDEPNIRFYAGYPLTSMAGDRIGTLCVIDSKPREFTENDVEKLELLGQLVEQELFVLRQATTDELTGLVNRRGFHMTGHHILDICKRLGQPATLVLFDMDGLKKINDTTGHKEGDRAIRDFGSCLLKTYRDSDVVARIGGDEFAILFAGTTQQDVSSLVARLQEHIQSRNTIEPDRSPLEFSHGVAEFDPRQGTSLQVLLSDADLEMYSRKRSKKQQTA